MVWDHPAPKVPARRDNLDAGPSLLNVARKGSQCGRTPLGADRRSQRRVRPGEPLTGQLDEQRRGPQVRILALSQPAVLQERLGHRR